MSFEQFCHKRVLLNDLSWKKPIFIIFGEVKKRCYEIWSMLWAGVLILKHVDQSYIWFHSIRSWPSWKNKHGLPWKVHLCCGVVIFHPIPEKQSRSVGRTRLGNFCKKPWLYGGVEFERGGGISKCSPVVETMFGCEVSLSIYIIGHEGKATHKCSTCFSFQSSVSHTSLFRVATRTIFHIPPQHCSSHWIVPIVLSTGSQGWGRENCLWNIDEKPTNHRSLQSTAPQIDREGWDRCSDTSKSLWCFPSCEKGSIPFVVGRDGEDLDSFTHNSKLWTMFQRCQTFNSRQHESWNVHCKCNKQTSRIKKETAVNLEKDPQLAELNPRQEPHGLFKRKVSLMTMPAGWGRIPRLHNSATYFYC